MQENTSPTQSSRRATNIGACSLYLLPHSSCSVDANAVTKKFAIRWVKQNSEALFLEVLASSGGDRSSLSPAAVFVRLTARIAIPYVALSL